MFSEDKVTEFFCWADEFCKFFDAQQEKSMLDAPQDGKRYRRKPNRMSDAESPAHTYPQDFWWPCKFFDKKPAIDVDFVNDGQLSLF